MSDQRIIRPRGAFVGLDRLLIKGLRLGSISPLLGHLAEQVHRLAEKRVIWWKEGLHQAERFLTITLGDVELAKVAVLPRKTHEERYHIARMAVSVLLLDYKGLLGDLDCISHSALLLVGTTQVAERFRQ